MLLRDGPSAPPRGGPTEEEVTPPAHTPRAAALPGTAVELAQVWAQLWESPGGRTVFLLVSEFQSQGRREPTSLS